MNNKTKSVTGSGEAPSVQLLKRCLGHTVTFHAYDGRDYRATLAEVKNKIASLQYYPISSAGTPIRYICTAFISDMRRISLGVTR